MNTTPKLPGQFKDNKELPITLEGPSDASRFPANFDNPEISAHGFSCGNRHEQSLMVTDLSVFTRTAKTIEKIKTAKAVSGFVPGIIPTAEAMG